MNEKWLRTNEIEDFIASLSMLELATINLENDMSAWKWIVISVHSALQGAIVCHLSFVGNSFIVAKEKDVEDWFRAHETHSPYPELMLDLFLNLYEKLKKHTIEGFRFSPKDTQGRSIKRINRYRNSMVHFLPKAWSIEVSGLPDICTDCLIVIKEIFENTMHSHMSEHQKSKSKNLLSACLMNINRLDSFTEKL